MPPDTPQRRNFINSSFLTESKNGVLAWLCKTTMDKATHLVSARRDGLETFHL